MDEKLFLQKLSEVAEWHRPQTGPNGAASVNKRARHPGPITQEQLDEMSDEEAQEYYDQLMAYKESQPNDNIAPEIVKLKPQPTTCDDCGLHCATGRRVESKISITGTKHWRTKCLECNLYKDPATGEFTLEPHRVPTYLSTYYRPKLGVYKSKHQPQPKAKPQPQVKERLREIVKIDTPKEEFQMVAYDRGDSVIYVREPISKE
jgi:hypothetical protein